MTDRTRVAVIIASAGRPELLGDVLEDLGHQTTQDFDLVVSVPDERSLPATPLPDSARVANDLGLAAQRNAGLDAVPEADVVVFFDDDAIPRADFVERAVEFFAAHPEVNALTGRVLLDGAAGDAISREDALAALGGSNRAPSGSWSPTRELYGCNFAFRVAGARGERFDGRLPLYSWLEDHDFARRLMRHGTLAKVDDCVIVHRGVKSGGRTAHERLGYSQMMNPAYLWHTGSFPLWLALHETVLRLGKNVILSIAGTERQWRRRRVRGNVRAIADVAARRFTPERAADIPPE